MTEDWHCQEWHKFNPNILMALLICINWCFGFRLFWLSIVFQIVRLILICTHHNIWNGIDLSFKYTTNMKNWMFYIAEHKWTFERFYRWYLWQKIKIKKVVKIMILSTHFECHYLNEIVLMLHQYFMHYHRMKLI